MLSTKIDLSAVSNNSLYFKEESVPIISIVLFTVSRFNILPFAVIPFLDLKKLNELQIKIDCDVINADGGTRTASITGGWIALSLLISSLLKNKILKESPIVDQISAISCGIYKGIEIIDLDYNEDIDAQTDANFVISKSKNLIEVQATAEKGNFNKEQLYNMIELACDESRNLFEIQDSLIKDEE